MLYTIIGCSIYLSILSLIQRNLKNQIFIFYFILLLHTQSGQDSFKTSVYVYKFSTSYTGYSVGHNVFIYILSLGIDINELGGPIHYLIAYKF